MEPPVFDETVSDRERDRLTREWRARVKEQEKLLEKVEKQVILERKFQKDSGPPIPDSSPGKKAKIDTESGQNEAVSLDGDVPTENADKNSTLTSSGKKFFVCDSCHACTEFVKPAPGQSGCKTCGCDLIHHLADDSEPDDELDAEDYQEWNDDEQELLDSVSDDDDDDAMQE